MTAQYHYIHLIKVERSKTRIYFSSQLPEYLHDQMMNVIEERLEKVPLDGQDDLFRYLEIEGVTYFEIMNCLGASGWSLVFGDDVAGKYWMKREYTAH